MKMTLLWLTRHEEHKSMKVVFWTFFNKISELVLVPSTPVPAPPKFRNKKKQAR